MGLVPAMCAGYSGVHPEKIGEPIQVSGAQLNELSCEEEYRTSGFLLDEKEGPVTDADITSFTKVQFSKVTNYLVTAADGHHIRHYILSEEYRTSGFLLDEKEGAVTDVYLTSKNSSDGYNSRRPHKALHTLGYLLCAEIVSNNLDVC
ncbi:7345_t:CDS:2 [Paraglomus brasilianum]|uniref:7345_t:CDS:1 n=1 Tax=Paraglomus brasilianum TaxID=144538 RepID=A0A9N9AG20_9GLOM|nr:7345_t:CDS:2 [Paraglomus brasilianum]